MDLPFLYTILVTLNVPFHFCLDKYIFKILTSVDVIIFNFYELDAYFFSVLKLKFCTERMRMIVLVCLELVWELGDFYCIKKIYYWIVQVTWF